MSKFIVVTDRQYDWFAARARGGHTMSQAIDHIIEGVDKYEKDLAKYQAWVNATQKKLEKGELP